LNNTQIIQQNEDKPILNFLVCCFYNFNLGLFEDSFTRPILPGNSTMHFYTMEIFFGHQEASGLDFTLQCVIIVCNHKLQQNLNSFENGRAKSDL